MKSSKLLYVIPECFVDTNLIEYLLNAGVNHQHCCVRPARTYSNGCKSLSRPNSGKATAEGKGVPVRRNLKEAVGKHLTRRTET